MADARSVVELFVGTYVTVRLKSVFIVLAPTFPKSWEVFGQVLLILVRWSYAKCPFGLKA